MSTSRKELCVTYMNEKSLDYLLCFTNGIHSFLEPNPVFLLTGFKNIGESFVVLRKDGSSTLAVTPSWEKPRLKNLSLADESLSTDNLVSTLATIVKRENITHKNTGIVGIEFMGRSIHNAIKALFKGELLYLDDFFIKIADTKTDEEIERARKASWIAERGYEKLKEVVHPGMYEYQLAGELDCYMKSLGADDDFLLMSASQHNQAVRPPSKRKLEKGDIILAEISPSYEGQFIQICRTVVLGEPEDILLEKYKLIQVAMQKGLQAAMPGVKMSDVVNALNEPLIQAGYEKYCQPPYMRVRGHGVGLSSILPGDVGVANDTELKEGMIFVLHPNQYIPETGYLLCGEPVLITKGGAQPLTEELAKLDAVHVN